MNLLRNAIWLIAIAGLLSFAHATNALCPFCGDGEKGATLLLQLDEAQMVLYGHFENARPAAGALGQGQTDFVIERVYKTHDIIKGMKKITLPRYVADSKTKFVIFADVYKGKIDAYKGTPVTDGAEMIRYVEGIIQRKTKSPSERLRFAFDFLNSPEIEVSMDAFREFARADYKDYKDMANKLPADTIAGWLQDPKTPSYRYGLYASLLGHCGNAKHAEMLLGMIEDPEKRKGSGLHGLMAAYTMLEPAKGWKYIKTIVKDADKPFLVRYAGLQTMRFLRDSRPDLVSTKGSAEANKEIVKGVAGIMTVPDMADFAIEDLRKWKQWDYCDQVLGLFGAKSFNTPIISKSILRYALQCPMPQARAFCKTQQARDGEWFNDTKELLELESPSSTK